LAMKAVGTRVGHWRAMTAAVAYRLSPDRRNAPCPEDVLGDDTDSMLSPVTALAEDTTAVMAISARVHILISRVRI